MTSHHDHVGYTIVALKRAWVPWSLFAMLRWVVPHQPFRWIFTRPADPGSFYEDPIGYVRNLVQREADLELVRLVDDASRLIDEARSK